MKKNEGFTLIELMVVISIISLISSIIFASVNIARAKARDVRKLVETNSVRTAMNLYYASNKVMPDMYNCASPCGGGTGVNNGRITLEIEDQANPTNPTTEAGKAYQATMNELVSGGFLASVPVTNSGSPYSFYNYGSGNLYGAMFGTSLEIPKTKLIANSCQVTALDLTNIDCQISNTGGTGSLGYYVANCYVNCRNYTNTSGSVLATPGQMQALDGRGGAFGALCVQVRSLCDPSNFSDYCQCAPY